MPDRKSQLRLRFVMDSKDAYKSTSSLFSRNELEDQLQRILKGHSFCDAPRLRKFLSFVVTKTIDENPDVITSYEIAIDAYERSPDFDPNDPYIRNIAVLVRKGLDSYYSEQTNRPDSKDRIKIEIPKVNYLAKFGIINNMTAARKNGHSLSRHGIDSVDAKNTTNHKVTKIRSNSLNYGNHISVNEKKSNVNPPSHKKPLLTINPFASFGNDNCTDLAAIGEILAAEIATGFSHSDSFNVASLLNVNLPQNEKYPRSIQPAVKSNYFLNGKYQIADGVILLIVELSENLAIAVNPTEIPGSKPTIIFSELIRIELDSIYLKRNDELQRLSKRLKLELNQVANAHPENSSKNSTSVNQFR